MGDTFEPKESNLILEYMCEKQAHATQKEGRFYILSIIDIVTDLQVPKCPFFILKHDNSTTIKIKNVKRPTFKNIPLTVSMRLHPFLPSK